MPEDMGDAGGAGGGSSPHQSDDEAVRQARGILRGLLSSLHVLEALPERSRMLAVDAELPVHAVLSAVLSEQHPRPPRSAYAGHQGPGGGAPHEGAAQSGGGGGGMRREGQAAAATEEPPLLSCGTVAPSMPSNVLAEVCEFDSLGNSLMNPQGDPAPPEDGADERSPARRRWTSPDDGWGMNLPMQDLEKMPMGMPVTVGELADFLASACASSPEATQKDGANHAQQRWAEPVGGTSSPMPSEDGRPPVAEGGEDMLDWSLAQWRAHRLKLSGHKVPTPEESEQSPNDAVESASRLFVEERPRYCGPVLVHRVPLAPPRPILCTDDPEASLLKVIELLLTYPELDAIPIVSPVRCTVVAHLTLAYCLAYMLGRMRGNDLLPLANLTVSAQDAAGGGSPAGSPAQRVFDSASAPGPERADCWAERRTHRADQPPWVLRQSQPLRDLLAFFARTHHSGVPVVEDETGGVVGLLSRRDLLRFLDLSMQSARRRSEGGAGSPETENVHFDADAPIEAMLDAMQRYRGPPVADDGASVPAALGGPSGIGATLVYEQQLTLKASLIRLLSAENRKLLFVKDGEGGSSPRLLRVLSVGDVWHLLIGENQDTTEARPTQEPMEVTDA